MSTTVATSTTLAAPTSTEPSEEVTPTPTELFKYAVVAEERARAVSVFDLVPCLDTNTCDLAPITRVELPERPHNLVGVGSVVYATHPAAGSVSRIDIASGATLTAAVGREPHDIKAALESGSLYVANEAGRQLLIVDADTLEVLHSIDLPAQPHALIVDGEAVWVTLIGRNELARVTGGNVELFATTGSPHDLIVDRNGLIWFSSWGSDILNIFDPSAGTTVEAPAGVSEPHHFAIGPDGAVWVSDNGGAAVVGFTGGDPVTVEVGPVPHHLAFVDGIIVVAVSGSGEAVFVADGEVVGRSQLTTGLHGVAAVALPRPLVPSG
ncbi:MAG: hypothetical protein ACE5MI_03750 [Acidimicrobiia bacterium]